MITVEGTKRKQKGTSRLNKQEVAIFRLIGIAIANQPEQIIKLLKDYGVDVPEKSNGSALTDAIIYAISQKDKGFNLELSKILGDQVIPNNYDSFQAEDLAGSGQQQGNVNVGGGGGLYGQIAGAVGKIFDFAGSVVNQKSQKQQARKESLMSMLAMQNQQEQMAANQQMQASSNATKTTIIKVVGVLALIALLGGLYLWQMKKNKKALEVAGN